MKKKVIKECTYKSAFTLAEVLVVLTIVGVIGALTIPALIQNTQMAQYKIALKETTADLSGALKRMAMANAGSLAGTFTDGYSFKNNMSTYLNVSNDCNGVGIGNCWPTSTLYMNGSTNIVTFWTTFTWSPPDPSITLANGSMVHFDMSGNSQSCTSNWFGESLTSNVCVALEVDINGLKPPNMLGYDTFRFFIAGDGTLVPFGAPTTSHDPIAECGPATSGQGCAANYLLGN